jgi:hypothetical protein
VRKIGEVLGLNQDIFIYLRGDATGRNGLIKEDKVLTSEINKKSTLPTLQTQVTLRSAIDKFN